MTASGGRPPSAASMRAPIAVSGAITRRIGRRESEASPTSVRVKGCAASMPGEQPHRGARSCRSRASRRGGREARPAAAGDRAPAGRRRRPGALHRDAEGFEAGQRRQAVGAGRVASMRRDAVGQRRQQRVAVRDGLVAEARRAPRRARAGRTWSRGRRSCAITIVRACTGCGNARAAPRILVSDARGDRWPAPGPHDTRQPHRPSGLRQRVRHARLRRGRQRPHVAAWSASTKTRCTGSASRCASRSPTR